MNVKLLRKVRKLIAEEPRRLRMGHWGIRRTPQEVAISAYRDSLPPCGTTACLAGHIILAAHPKKAWPRLFRFGQLRLGQKTNRSGDRTLAAIKAAKLIGLPFKDCPFEQIGWGPSDVLNWIDEQIAKAKGRE